MSPDVIDWLAAAVVTHPAAVLWLFGALLAVALAVAAVISIRIGAWGDEDIDAWRKP